MKSIEILQYQTKDGKTPVSAWLDGLRDGTARARIVARLDRLATGLLGDWKALSGGVSELRIDHGPGYRVYFAQRGDIFVLRCVVETNARRRKT